MRRTIDYKKSPCPRFDAVADIMEYLGQEKYDEFVRLGMGQFKNVRQFSFFCMLAGIDGFPVEAWYDHFHGEGAWQREWTSWKWESPAMPNLRERTAHATPVGKYANYNSWPTLLEIVSKRELDMSNPKQAYDAGMMMGVASSLGELRQIDGADIPGWMHNQRLMCVWFVLKHPAGQIDDESKRNILAVWETRKWNAELNGFDSRVHIWELGCKHRVR